MNLDDLNTIHSIDRDNMLPHIDAFAKQLADAWQLAQTLTLAQ